MKLRPLPGQGRRDAARPRGLPAMAALLPLAACGGAATPGRDGSAPATSGLPAGYAPPPSAYVPPASADPDAFLLLPEYINPYWVQALGNADHDWLSEFYDSFDDVVAFTFPQTMPDYLAGDDTVGWAPASSAVRAAFRAVVADLGQMFDVTFTETDDPNGFNVIAISQNDQEGLAGYAYFPLPGLYIGSDILISNEMDAPARSGPTTNDDYEVLIHELGHALGLKHPFEADGEASVILPEAEDNTRWTAMTYTLEPGYYDGGFRDLDLMALAGIFGVNPGWRAGDDTYAFSAGGGVFVLDGGGVDTISAAGRSESAMIDLRPGMHSHLGPRADLITAPWQLTVSAGSGIENATGGAGDDHLVGNALANLLMGGEGRDQIFAGEGADRVRGGRGDDVIDLSEAAPGADTVVFETDPATNGADTIHGFVLGQGGDVVEFVPLAGAELLAVVAAARVPAANVGGMILRLVDDGLVNADALRDALSTGGDFAALHITEGAEALVLTARSQQTGADQHLFHVAATGAALIVSAMATFSGNALDIDAWHGTNFA